MASIAVETVKTPVTTYVDQDAYTINLSKDEAQWLRNVLGHVELSGAAQDVWFAFNGVLSYQPGKVKGTITTVKG